jgi:hypothetical protein
MGQSPVRLSKLIHLTQLADLVALKAVLLATGALNFVFGLDALPVRAGVLVVIDFAMLRRFLGNQQCREILPIESLD